MITLPEIHSKQWNCLRIWTQNFMIDIKGQCLYFRSIPRSNSIINRNQKSIHWTTGRKLGRDSQFALDQRYFWKPEAKEKDINCNLKSHIQKVRCYVFGRATKSCEQSRIDGKMVMYLNGKLVVWRYLIYFNFIYHSFELLYIN